MSNLQHLPLEERRLVWAELEEDAPLDLRFKTLLGEEEWSKLPKAVQRRFSRHMEDGKSIIYKGVITKMEATWTGRFLGQVCKLIGAPLPTEMQANGTPAIVTVTDDKNGNGQFWSRTYGRKTGFPQVIHSSKRFQGPTGLQEYIGYGIGMNLKVEREGTAIVFKSEGYYLELFSMQIPFPSLLQPGKVKVSHDDQGEGYFAFILEVEHPLFGKMIHQRGIFYEHDVVVA